MTFYVIFRSWEDKLYKVFAWSKSPYIAKRFFDDQYVDGDILKIIEADGHMGLLNKMIYNNGSSIEDIYTGELIMRPSNDLNLYAIYRNENASLFNFDEMNDGLQTLAINSIVRIYLSLLNIYKYIIDMDESILNLAIKNDLVLRNPNGNIDTVYLWYCIINHFKTSNFGESFITPSNITFIKP